MRNGRIYALLNHLKSCGGCTGKRSRRRCDYAIVCAVVETLAKNGANSNPEEMLPNAYWRLQLSMTRSIFRRSEENVLTILPR